MVPPESKEKLDEINSNIQNLLGKMEQYGEEGRVDESQALMRVMDRLKAEKEILLRGGIVGITGNGVNALGGIGQEKKMRVCETCGAFLVVGDTEKRMASHLEGKQHQGYAKIRQAIEEYHKRKEEEHKSRRSSGGVAYEKDRDHRDRDPPRERERDRDREKDRDRDRDRFRERDRFNESRGGRDYRDRDRERDRDRRDVNRGYRDDRKRSRDEDR
jgi:hypothetical protein